MRRIDLAGKWTLNSDGPIARDIPATVPGDTHSALLAAGLIADPYVECNERDLQSLNRESWDYTRSFEVDPADLAEESVYLVCEGLDTVADLFINEQKVAYVDNMHQRWVFDVKPLLCAGSNHIRIHFFSAECEAEQRAISLPYPIPSMRAPIESLHRNLVRKVACHAGWDWGCCLMTAGICGPIGLEAGPGRIEYIYTDQEHAEEECRLTVHVEYRSALRRETEFRVEIDGRTVTQTVALSPGMNRCTIACIIETPRLWWPNGAGEPHLYMLTVSVDDQSCTRKVGLRTLELVSEEDEIGRSMLFRVNGRDIFCKGANWIPCDALPQRQTPEVYADLLGSAVAAHMNMLRVWGGGQYERDVFYELCDELGLMVWQDFMFACALYPATPPFLESVRGEARHQVKRLRGHACLALWCGDNENIGKLGSFKESRDNRDRYLVDYDRLNHGVLAAVVAECDPDRAFWPSSPCAGPNDFSDCWYHDRRGDMHMWSVWHGNKSFDAFTKVTPRFCSEFGYQSLPSLPTISTFCTDDQLNLTSPVMEHHQRNERGNSKILEMFSRYFRIPEGFEALVYLSQVQQALAIQTAVEYWRLLRPTCMGTLYWQLNDNWPVSSWSSLEYGGTWKILHYAARRFYAPLIVTAQRREDGPVEIHVINDRLSPVLATATLQVRDFQGVILSEQAAQVTVPAAGSDMVWTLPVDDPSLAGHDVFLYLRVVSSSDQHENAFFLQPFKRLPLAKTEIRATVRETDGQLYVDLATDKPAFFVHLEATGLRGYFEDSGFTLLPDAPRSLRFHAKDSSARDDLQRMLSVRHLRDTYR